MSVCEAAMDSLRAAHVSTKSATLAKTIAERTGEHPDKDRHHGHAAHGASHTMTYVMGVALPIAFSVLFVLIRSSAHDAHALHSWLVIACMTIVVLLTWAFEEAHHMLVHTFKGNDHYEKIVSVLMQEVTTLGFISFCLFLAVKSGLVTMLASCLISPQHGHGHEGHGHEHGHDNTHAIVEVFEEVHVLVFLVMVLLMALDVWLLRGTDYFQVTKMSEDSPQKLRKLYYEELRKVIEVGTRVKVYVNDTTREGTVTELSKNDITKLAWYVKCDSEVEPQEFLAKDVRLIKRAPMWHHMFALFFGGQTALEKVEAQLAHRSMRREFDSKLTRAMSKQFKFSLYLTQCYVDLVLKLIKVEPTSHVIVLFVSLCVRPLFLWATKGRHFIAMSTLCLILLIALVTMRLKIDWIAKKLTPPLNRILEEDSTKARAFKSELHSSGRVTSSSPVWHAICGTSKPTRQEQLFWFWRNGPEFLERGIQLILLLLACFGASFVVRLWHVGIKWYAVTSLLLCVATVVLLLAILPSTLRMLTVITSIEEMKKKAHIRKTVELVGQEGHVQILPMLLLLKGHTVVTWAKKVKPEDAASEWKRLFKRVGEREKEKSLADDAFQPSRIGASVRDFGFLLTDSEIQSIMDAMKQSGILCNPEVSREDFYVIIAVLNEQKRHVMDMESLRALFDEIDESHSGAISADELYRTLTKYDMQTSGVGKEDCRAFVREARHFAGHEEDEEEEEEHEFDVRSVETVTLEALIKWIKSLESRLDTHIFAD